jgi:hypothetical protein
MKAPTARSTDSTANTMATNGCRQRGFVANKEYSQLHSVHAILLADTIQSRQ